MKKEFTVGIFLILGLLMFGIAVFLIKDIRLQKGYRINLYFTDVGNLMERAWVRMRGVKIGRVERILLENDKAKVVLWIDAKVKLYKGMKARITSTGVLGVKYIEILQGDVTKGEIKNGENVYDTESVVSIDEALSTAGDTLKKFSELLTDLSKEKDISLQVKEIISNLQQVTQKVNTAVDEKQLASAIKNFSTAGESVTEFLSSTKQDINKAVLTLKDVSNKLDNIIENIKSTETIAGQIISDKESGKKVAETISSLKLVAEKADKTLNRINMFTTYWDYRTRYEVNNEVFKSDIGLEIYPKSTKFYYIGVNNISSYNNNAIVATEKPNSLSLGIGGNFYNLITLYGGLIRSYGGIGIKLFPAGYKSKLVELNLETYNFSSMSSLPQIDLGLKIKLVKWLYLGARYEGVSKTDLLNTTLNVYFEDEDIAYLLGLIGLTQ